MGDEKNGCAILLIENFNRISDDLMHVKLMLSDIFRENRTKKVNCLMSCHIYIVLKRNFVLAKNVNRILIFIRQKQSIEELPPVAWI